MIVRIDTTNITRGREFTLYAKNPNDQILTIRSLKPSTGIVEDIEMQHGTAGEFDAYRGIAPSLDGYLIGSIGKQKIAKKIGMPMPAFVVGYKEGYTLPYKAYDVDGVLLEQGNLNPVGDGFYYTLIPSSTVVVFAMSKNFLVNKNLLKMNYEVEIEGGSLDSQFDNFAIENIQLPNIQLPNMELGDATLNSILPTVSIKEL